MQKIKLGRMPAAALLVTLCFAANGSVAALSASPTRGADTTAAASSTSTKSDTTATKAKLRQKVCEAHKHSLTTHFGGITTNAQKAQDRIDSIYSKALAYRTAHNLQPTNFASLVATATSAKATSADSVAGLKTAAPTIDCTSDTVATDVASFKTATATTRDNLKAYRAAVKAVLQSLETVKPATTKASI